MLSIIVSSYQEGYFSQFSKNVKETIGDNFEYEIIQQWNPGIMGICEAYNKGAEKAKYDNLLFVHEDVVFETNNWGDILLDYLKLEKIGCVGIAGSSDKTKFPIAWWNVKDNVSLNIKQFAPKSKEIKYYKLDEDKYAKILDGVFIAVSKDIWGKYKFNENANKSFHGYDVEFSLDVSLEYNNIITCNILLTHFSEGSLNKEWFNQLIRIYQKKSLKSNTDIFTFKYLELFLRSMVEYQLTKKEKIKIFLSFYNPLDFSISNNLKILNLFKFYFNKNVFK